MALCSRIQHDGFQMVFGVDGLNKGRMRFFDDGAREMDLS